MFDWPEQAACLVEISVVGPTVERGKALAAISRSSASIAGAIGASAVPRHTDEKRTVVSEVCGPPVLRLGHQVGEILFQGCKIEALEFLGVVEICSHWIGLGGSLVEDTKIQLVRPPITVCRAAAGDFIRLTVIKRTLGFG